ncbi:MAG: hypothetical protein HY923_04535 [Elusimicrobia bacterium]|nr:hypothetical protein [Elusimicrobiota bacterium]
MTFRATLLAVLLTAACSPEPVVVTIDPRYAGIWTSRNSVHGPLSKVVMGMNGRYEGTCVKIKDCRQVGQWFVREGALVWIYDFQPGKEDINPILETSGSRFVLREVDGSTTTFTRVAGSLRK